MDNLRRHELVHTELESSEKSFLNTFKRYQSDRCQKVLTFAAYGRYQKIHHCKDPSKWSKFNSCIYLTDFPNSPYAQIEIVSSISEASFKMRNTQDIKTYSCSYAQQEIVSTIPEASLKMRNNQDIKIYSCNQCSYATVYASNLKKHTMIHTGVRPYKCNECDQAFAKIYYLQRHLLIHTGEKPFKCPKCPETFQRKRSLINHGAKHYKS
ncbi:hypothetical protein TNIN_376331 [Trichonephila inaurata madagascariensis]|uniref:C2H2-type domain-containing protein n=1 Tax=Trichonephila inaurata madagascariensis TaxID=2747483 RepID=A0A8X6XBB4_9ARAC|nr:hypothetical protein TNIN_376331 [Trichonephila inaurata madagascariensis]